MDITFEKYQGTGNDFIMLDNRQDTYSSLSKDDIASLCHRRFGIGADGLILLQNHSDFDFEMVYFNSDGAQSSMCGNGGRCIARFAHDLGLPGTHYRFLAIDGPHEATIEGNTVRLKMGDVETVQAKGENDFFTDTGSPHYVRFAEQVMDQDLIGIAQGIRYADEYAKEGTNVNLVEVKKNTDELVMRTYERGVEDETYSCGTGVTAAVLVSHAAGALDSNKARVQTKGGLLSLEFRKEGMAYRDIWLSGAADFVFKGQIQH
jgi:diaminopimelate epimerase